MRLWTAAAVICAIAITIPALTLQYVGNRIDTYPHGLQKRDVYGEPVINFGSMIVDYVCNVPRCPAYGTEIVYGIYPKLGVTSLSLFILRIVFPVMLLVIAAFLAGRASSSRK